MSKPNSNYKCCKRTKFSCYAPVVDQRRPRCTDLAIEVSTEFTSEGTVIVTLRVTNNGPVAANAKVQAAFTSNLVNASAGWDINGNLGSLDLGLISSGFDSESKIFLEFNRIRNPTVLSAGIFSNKDDCDASNNAVSVSIFALNPGLVDE